MAADSVNWAALKEFIAKSEAFESQVGQPAPLTAEQKEAIRLLVTPPPPAASENDFNYIGRLQEWIQKAKLPMPTFNMESVAVQTKGTVTHWRCKCEMDIPPTRFKFAMLNSFPCEGFGLNPGQPPPAFARKQDAKVFAARMACEYLDSRGLQVLPESVKPQASHGSFPTAAPPATEAAAPESRASAQDGGASLIDPDMPVSQPAATEELVLEIPSATAQIADLAKKLKVPAPQFHISQDPTLHTWNGKCDFQHNPIIPNGLGNVMGARSQKEAKKMMADKVLSWMLWEHERRADIKRKFVEDYAA